MRADHTRPEGAEPSTTTPLTPNQGQESASGTERPSARDDVGFMAALYEADNAASVAHDFIWGKNGVTQQQASDAIWTIHNSLRPHLDDDPPDLVGPPLGIDWAEEALRNIDDRLTREYLAKGKGIDE